MIFLFVLSVFLGGSTCGWGHVPPNIAQLPKDFKTQPDDELIDMSDWGQSLKFSFRSRPPPPSTVCYTWTCCGSAAWNVELISFIAFIGPAFICVNTRMFSC